MQIIGHRGARGEAPENTLGGFQYIQDLGIRAVEFDVRQLSDDALIVMHDDQLIRTTGQDKFLYDCQQFDVMQYDHAFHWKDWDRVEPTPLLNQTLQIMHNFEHLEVEIKAVDTQDQANRLVEALQRDLQNFQHSAVITSFDPKIHIALQQQNSVFKRGLLIEDDIRFKAIDQALELGCVQIGWMNQLATDDIIQATQNADLNISVWTVNEIDRAKQLRDLGIQGLITDFPKLMLQHL